MSKFTTIQEAWLQDLETTDAPQTQHTLEDPSGFCCLGRAAIILDPSNRVEDDEGIISWEDCTAMLPEYLQNLLQIHGATGKIHFSKITDPQDEALLDYFEVGALAGLNDKTPLTFKQIAGFIRRNPEAVFHDPRNV